MLLLFIIYLYGHIDGVNNSIPLVHNLSAIFFFILNNQIIESRLGGKTQSYNTSINANLAQDYRIIKMMAAAPINSYAA